MSVGMLSIRTCIDVDNLDRGVSFYTQALGLTAGRKFKNQWVELLGAPSPIDLVAKEAGTQPVVGGQIERHYSRHWTPVHLDFVVDDIEDTLSRCVAAGAKVEQAIAETDWGKIAILADPFGHGFCLLEFRGRGYDEIPE